MRNSAPTTIAPTGTISIIAGCSSGIEPLFALSYVRNVMDNTRLVEGYPIFEAVAHNEGFYSQALMERLADTGSVHELDGEIPQWVKRLFVTSHDITPEWHVAYAGGLPEAYCQRRIQDHKLPPYRHCSGHRKRLHAGIRAGLQGNHYLQGRQQRQPGSQHGAKRAAYQPSGTSRWHHQRRPIPVAED